MRDAEHGIPSGVMHETQRLSDVSGSEERWQRLRPALAGWSVFAVALLVRLLYVLNVPAGTLGGDAKEYDELAWRLAEGRGFVNATGEPTAFWPPVFPLFMGLIYHLAGHDPMPVRVVQAFLGAGTCAVSYGIALRAFNLSVAKVSGLACALYPPLIINAGEIMTEPLFTLLLTLGLWLPMTARRPWHLTLAGIALGAALLTRPFILFLLPFLAYWIIRNDRHAAAARLGFLFGAIILVVLPWTLRNYDRMHAFIPFANVGGRSVYSSYIVPERDFSFNAWQGLGTDYYALGETEQSRYLTRKGLEYIADHPVQVLALIPKKLLLFVYPFDGYWYAVSLGSKFDVFWGLVMCLSAVGLAMHWTNRNSHATLLYLAILSFVAGSMVFYGSPRFRLPLDPLLISFAVQGAAYLYPRHRIALGSILLLNAGAFVAFRMFGLESLFEWLRAWR